MGALTPIADNGLNLLATNQAQQKGQDRASKEQKMQLRALNLEDSRRRKAEKQRLDSKIAAQRSRAGSNGTSLTGGSIDAILRNLQDQAESDALVGAARSQTKARSIRNNNRARGINLLNFGKLLKQGFR